MGFDSPRPKKKDLSICTADTILERPHHYKLLIRIHQAVHNPSAQYKLSEKGCMIDSTPSHHQYPNGTFGTHFFYIPDQPHTWKFDITFCLVTLPHRAPTHEEASTRDPIEITTLDHWNPSDHNSSHIENIRSLLQFSPDTYDES